MRTQPESLSLRSKTSRFYNPALDGLRFLAFFGVFLHHTVHGDPEKYAKLSRLPHSLAGWIAAGSRSFGGAGVDLFFVLSAYLITTLLLMEKERTGGIDIRAFYIRRTLRIWPLYYSVLLLIFLLRHVWLAPAGMGYYLLSAAFLGNWALAFYRGSPGAITPLWSVSVEEQFYVVWPWVAAKCRRATMVFLAGAIFFGCLAVRFWLARNHATYNQLSANTFARMGPIGLGTVLALYPRMTAVFSRIKNPLWVLAVCVIGIIALERPTPFGETSSYYTAVVKYPLTALLCMLMVGVLVRPDCANIPLLTSRPFVYLGRISYGLYMIHGLMLALMPLWLGEGSAGGLRALIALPAALLATLAAAALSFQFFERPFMSLKERYAKVPSRPGG